MPETTDRASRPGFREALWGLIRRQRGYIRTEQVKRAGFTNALVGYHCRSGKLVREARGVYRLAEFPASAADAGLVAFLWSRERGVLSGWSAVFEHGLVESPPESVSLTVPRTLRNVAQAPPGVGLIVDDLLPCDITECGPVRLVTVARAIAEVASRHDDLDAAAELAARALEGRRVTLDALEDAFSRLLASGVARDLLASCRSGSEASEGRVVPFPGGVGGRLATNVEEQPYEFVGREGELGLVHELLSGPTRPVTIFGPAGIGKTTIARRYIRWLAEHAPERFPGGAWFCDLSQATTGQALERLVADSLAAAGHPLDVAAAARELPRVLAQMGSVLLVLDNFEQVIDAGAAVVRDWLAAAPDLALLITSREVLGVSRERSVELSPLNTPPSGCSDAKLAERSDAVRLFLSRTRLHKPRYELCDEDAGPVSAIVTRLDGNPLAIELAAARMKVLGPQTILTRLADRFKLLRRTSRDRPARQTSLVAALEWSWDLMNPTERSAVCQAAVFRGGFGIEAAERVIRLADSAVLDVLQALHDKSMVAVHQVADGEPRFSLFESIREFAWQKAREGDLVDGAVDRHRGYFLEVGLRWADDVDRRGQRESLRHLASERANLMYVFDESVERVRAGQASGAAVVQAALSLDPLLYLRGPVELHQQILQTALDLAPPDAAEPALLSQLLASWASCIRTKGRGKEATEAYQRALRLAEESGRLDLQGRVHSQLGFARAIQREFDDALAHYERALTLLRGCNEVAELGVLHGRLGAFAYLTEDLVRARDEYERALAAHRQVGNQWYEGIVLCNLGLVQQRQGSFRLARETFEAAADVAHRVGNPRTVGVAHGSLGKLFLDHGDHSSATYHLDAAEHLHVQHSDLRAEGVVAAYRGLLYMDAREHAGARRSLGAAISAQRKAKNGRWEGITRVFLALMDLLQGSLELARMGAEDAALLLRDNGDVRHNALAQAILATARAQLGESGAEAAFEAALGELPARGADEFHGALTALRSCAALSRGEVPDAEKIEIARLVVSELRGPGPIDEDHPWGGPSAADQSVVCRLALRVLTNSLSPESVRVAEAQRFDRQLASLIVLDDGRSLRPPGQDWVDLRRRRALPGIVARLLESRTQCVGSARLSVAELLEAGWPGERVLAEAGTHRVYVAVETLRKMGLRQVLLRDERGYYLDPSRPVIWVRGRSTAE